MNFFDSHNVLYPWPSILRRDKLEFLYKPREVWWNSWINKLNLKKGLKVLEVGCGRGILLDRLTGKYGIKGTGIDIARDAILEAKKESVYHSNLKFADAVNIPSENSAFDIVISFDTLEHIQNQKMAIEEMTRVLKPGGKLLIYTINSKQEFTWNHILSKLGVDVYSDVEHKPNLFVDSIWLKDNLIKSDISTLQMGYFDAFFTLIVDEIIMILLKYLKILFGWENTRRFAKMIIGFLSMISKITTPLLIFFDTPWTFKGNSNSFIILGQKR